MSDRTLRKPLAIDLFCGLGGWAEGLLAEGYDVVGFDNERHLYPARAVPESDGQKGPSGVSLSRTVSGKGTSASRSFNKANAQVLRNSPLTGGWSEYPGQLVLQDVLTLHGSQFRDAALLVASPPCQNYSYLAMPWSRSQNPNNSKAAKALRHKWETEGPDNRLFDACFRIQREAIEASTCPGCNGKPWGSGTDHECPDCLANPGKRYIPLIVENVRGAQPWVGRSSWNYGSFHLWGDVPALMPINRKRGQKVPGFRFDGSGGSFQTASVEATGQKQNPDGTNHPTGSWFRIADSSQGDRGQKVPVYSDPRRNGGKGVHLTSPAENEAGTKIGGDWFSDPQSTCRKHGSRSNARKAASAQIAKIPFDLARHIAAVYHPRTLAQGARLRDAAGKY